MLWGVESGHGTFSYVCYGVQAYGEAFFLAESSYCVKYPAVSLSPLSAKIQRGCSDVLQPIAPDWRHLAFIESLFLKENYQMTGRILLCSTRVIIL